MNKSEYLMALYDALSDIPTDIRTDIVSEYREYFNSELNKAKTEEEIIISLGDPVTLAYAVKQRRGYGQENYSDNNTMHRKHRKPRRSQRKSTGLILLFIGVLIIVGTGLFSRLFNGISGNTLGFGIRERYDVDEYKEVNIDSFKNIIIKIASSDTVIKTTSQDELTGHLKGDVRTTDPGYVPHLSIEPSGDTLIIEVKRNSNNSIFSYTSNLRLNIAIPDTFSGNIDYKSTSGNLEMSDFTLDNLTLNQTSGDVKIEEIELNGKFEISTVSGNSNISNLSAQSIKYKASSGDRRFDTISIDGDIDIKTTSGNTSINNLSCAKLSINSTSGDIKIDDATLKLLSIESMSGNIALDDLESAVDIKTTAGDTKLSFSKVIDNIYIKSISGNINLYLPEESGFKLSCKSASGNIDCDFNLKDMDKGKNSLSGVYGKGKNDISISATAGNINIKEN